MSFNYGQTPTIAIQNRATIDLGCNLTQTVIALQMHLDRDFFPAWGRTAKLQLIAPGEQLPDASWHLLLVDEAGEPGAEGYHDLTDDGFPIMYIGIRDTISASDKVSVTICHEIDEGIIDPAINAGVQRMAGPHAGQWWAAESNDAVEEDEYDIAGVAMSNFQLPAWFMDFEHPPGTKFDFLGLCTRPFEIRHGGYASVFSHGRWTQQFGSKHAETQHAKRPRRRHQLRAMGGRRNRSH